MSYLINEIYELYEKHLEITEPVLKNMGVEDNIHNYLIDVNIDLEILLESNDIIRYEYDELQDKIKQAYDEIFKEGILFGIIVGKIIKLNNCLEDKEKYNEIEKNLVGDRFFGDWRDPCYQCHRDHRLESVF